MESIDKWLNVEFDSSCYKTPQFNSFARVFRNALKRRLPMNSQVVFYVGHFFISGFISRNGKHVYFSVSDVRFFKNDWYKNILVRTAKDLKDYTGGMNHYTMLNNFKSAVENLLSA